MKESLDSKGVMRELRGGEEQEIDELPLTSGFDDERLPAATELTGLQVGGLHPPEPNRPPPPG